MRWGLQGCSDHRCMSFDWTWHSPQTREWLMWIKKRYRQSIAMQSFSLWKVWGTGEWLESREQKEFLQKLVRGQSNKDRNIHIPYATPESIRPFRFDLSTQRSYEVSPGGAKDADISMIEVREVSRSCLTTNNLKNLLSSECGTVVWQGNQGCLEDMRNMNRILLIVWNHLIISKAIRRTNNRWVTARHGGCALSC